MQLRSVQEAGIIIIISLETGLFPDPFLKISQQLAMSIL